MFDQALSSAWYWPFRPQSARGNGLDLLTAGHEGAQSLHCTVYAEHSLRWRPSKNRTGHAVNRVDSASVNRGQLARAA